MKYDIFISYRREGGYETAKHLNDLLVRDGYRVSFDIDTLRSGDFDTQLLERIDQCKDFILIVDQHAFDRTLDPSFDRKKDWLRCELAYALKKGKNIIPIFLAGADGFPNNLPSDVAGATKKNGPEYNKYHFNAFYKDLKKRFLKSAPSHNYYIFLLLLLLIMLLLGGIYYHYYTNKSSYSSEDSTNVADNKSMIVETNGISKESGALTKDDAMSLFCGEFQIAWNDVITFIWDLELDPINSKASYKLKELYEDADDIVNTKGWCGTFTNTPQYWIVTSFNLKKDHKSALVEMMQVYDESIFEDSSKPDHVMCSLLLELDEFNNIKMSFINGNGAPWILASGDGFKHDVTFVRQ